MIRIAICDDEIRITSEIEEILLQLCDSNRIETDISVFFDGQTLEDSILSGKQFDLIYLDIEMKTRNGIEAAKNIRKIDQNVLLIYISIYENYMKELFEVDAYRFISKPIDKKIFEKYFLKAYERLYSCAIYYEYQYKKEIFKVLIGEIVYFESKARTIKIILSDGREEKFNGKLNDVERKLINNKINFLRIHQSFLVNYQFIKSMKKTQAKLLNGSILQISEDRQKHVLEQYCKMLGVEINDL